MKLFRIKKDDLENGDGRDKGVAADLSNGDETIDNREAKTDSVNDESTEINDDENRDDYEGVVRTVPNAHLVLKRKQPDGTFKEVWEYNITDIRDSMKIRHAILAGTDIPNDMVESPDGKQSYQLWSVGNYEQLILVGLPN